MKVYKTCQIEDLLVVSEESDFTLKYLLKVPRTIVLSNEVPNPAWVGNSVNVHDAYINTRGLDAVALASLHYWENRIAFDYIDVGANTGFVVCVQAIFHKKCGRYVLSHAFEPGDVFEALKRTVAANRLSANIMCNDAAISDRNGFATFYNTNEHSEASSLRSTAVERFPITDKTEKIVKTVRLDDYEKIRDVPGVIAKIDIEGADVIALTGMSKLLSDQLCDLSGFIRPFSFRNEGLSSVKYGQQFNQRLASV